MQKELNATNQQALVVFNVFKCHITQPDLDLFVENNITVLTNMTNLLQTLDLRINGSTKINLRHKFSDW